MRYLLAVTLLIVAPSFALADEYDGMLRVNIPERWEVGDWGRMYHDWLEVLTVVDDSDVLMDVVHDNGLLGKTYLTILLRGIDTSKMTTGKKFKCNDPVVITGTYSYTTVSGAKKTVLLVERNQEKVEKLVKANKGKKFEPRR
jgi:hypothetical protein